MIIKTVPTGEIMENCYVLYLQERDDALLIDPGDEPEKIKEALGGRQVAAMLLTHGHWDHTGALHAFPDVPIYIHKADAHMLRMTRFTAGSFVQDVQPRPAPTDFVTDGQILKLAGITLQVLHTPGHTPGGVCYRVGDDIFTGDTLFDGDYGRTDLPGGSMAQMRESLRMLLSLHGCHAYPGHGGSMRIA
jgi:hydroxyacylglutathione hydrolase